MNEWRTLRNQVKREIIVAKASFYDSPVKDLKNSQSGKWHSPIRSLCNLKQARSVIPGAILDPCTTAENVNQHFVNICSQLPALKLHELSTYLLAEAPPTPIFRCQVF